MESEEEDGLSRNFSRHCPTQKIAVSKARGSGIVAIEVPSETRTANVVKGDAQGIASNDGVVSSATTIDVTRVGPLRLSEAKRQGHGHGQEIPSLPCD